MAYPSDFSLGIIAGQMMEYARLKHEYGSEGVEALLRRTADALGTALEEMKALPECTALAAKEPNDLPGILALRADGPRRLWKALPEGEYLDRLEGAMLARFAGCTLGAPVELWTVEAMEMWADYLGIAFPLTDYWPKAAPSEPRRRAVLKEASAGDGIDGVPQDDDITYTVLGMLIAEEHGVNFTTDDVGRAWLKYLPFACSAEDVALSNLKKGVSAARSAEIDNPYCQWIGADIRSDPWAYMAPAWPERAARLAYSDAYLSHRRGGIYGSMFFAAAQSAAFCVDNAADALEIGLTEIPAGCALYGDVQWALRESGRIKNYKDARLAVDERFAGMSAVHTNNNAALTVFGLMLGGNDVAKVLGEVAAMGMDNDCTTATAGSIVGALVGKKGVPERFYKPFHNKLHTYLTGASEFRLDDLVDRFAALAAKVYA